MTKTFATLMLLFAAAASICGIYAARESKQEEPPHTIIYRGDFYWYPYIETGADAKHRDRRDLQFVRGRDMDRTGAHPFHCNVGEPASACLPRYWAIQAEWRKIAADPSLIRKGFV